MKNIIFAISFWLVITNVLSGASESHTYVLVHGAWHGNWTYYKLEYELVKAGHKVICVNLPGHGLDTTAPGKVTLADYQNAIVEVLDTVSEPVVLVGHSMGGIAISMAAEARPEKIDKLVYLAAFMPKDGESMLELALKDSLSMIGPSLIFDFPNNTVDLVRENISDIFYGSSTAEYVHLSEMLLTPNPLQPLTTTLSLTPEKYGSVRRFYITTSYDKAITPAFQEKMYTEQPCEEVYTLNTEHSPFFSAPNRLKNILDKIGDTKEKSGKKSTSEEKIQNINSDYEISVYFSGTDQISVQCNKLIKHCTIDIISLDGKYLDTYNLTPMSDIFEIPFEKNYDEVVILLFNIKGTIISRKLVVNF